MFYIGYTLYILLVINSTTITFLNILPAILLMWFNYFAFSAGYRATNKSLLRKYSVSGKGGWLNNQKKVMLFVIALVSIVFSVMAVNYYTGQTPLSVLRNLSSDVSLYYEYQNYFKEQHRHLFSISKMPYIFMLFFCKFILFYSFITFLIVKDKITKFEKIYLGLVTLSFIYIGVARGTNYEFFELIMIIIFVLLFKQKPLKFKFPLKSLLIISILISVMIYIFYIGVSARGVKFNYFISNDVFYDSEGLLPAIMPFLSFVTIIIYSYFGFGFFYTATYISEVWFSSFYNFIAGLIPMGYIVAGGDSLQSIMRTLVDIGPRWHPDTIGIINGFGYIGLLMFCFFIGFISKNIQRSSVIKPIELLSLFIIFVQMVSLPVGNFVIVSSANQLIVILLTFYWIWKRLLRIKMKL